MAKIAARYSFTRLATVISGIRVVMALASALVFGQNFSAAISGVVHDPTGAVLPGVSITAKHTDTGLTRTVISNENGDYRMPSLPVGAYEVLRNYRASSSRCGAESIWLWPRRWCST